MNFQNLNLARLKRSGIILGILLVIIFVVNFIYSHSFIEFETTGNAETTYSLYNEKSPYPVILKKQGSFKRLVGKGSYQVIATAGDKSYVSAFKAGAFLSSTKLTVTTIGEAGRSFVGNNPSDCMQYTNGILASNACGSAYAYQKTHIPGDAQIPTYVDTDVSAPGNVEGLHVVNGALYELIEQELYGSAIIHVMNRVVPQLRSSEALVDATDLLLPSTKTYDFAGYKDGFVTYTPNLDTIDYFPSFTFAGKPTAITIKPTQKGMTGEALSVYGKTTLVVLYTDSVVEKRVDVAASTKSEIVLKNDAGTSDYNLKKPYSTALLCGKTSLCALTPAGQLDVYSFDASSAHLEYSLYNVARMMPGQKDSQIVVANDVGLTLFDTTSRSGYQLYSYGGYHYASSSETGGAYLVSLSGLNNAKFALLIDPAAQNADSIDKKILQLQADSAVDGVSVYGTNIAVILNRGNPIYGPDGQAGYSPTNTAAAAAKAATAIKNIGIDTGRYSITGLN